MEFVSFYENLKSKLKQMTIDLTEEQGKQLYIYMQLLIQWNQKMNLTAITEPIEVIDKHFVDSLTIKKYIKEGESIVDIGTGAGFPGIPLAIMQINNSLSLVDSLNKRIQFLEEVKGKLNLNNVSMVHSRAEDYARIKRETYDIATSRAVASLPVLLEYLLPLVKVGGKCICMKGPEVKEEIENAQKCLNILGGKIKQIDEISLPNTQIRRNIILIEKVKKTPIKYPRKAGIPAKEPIC